MHKTLPTFTPTDLPFSANTAVMASALRPPIRRLVFSLLLMLYVQYRESFYLTHILGGAWGSVVVKALRCATSRTFPGSIPGGVTGFFSDISPSDRTMALESTKPLVKMSNRNIPGGKGGRCVRLPSPSLRAERHAKWEPKPPGTPSATPYPWSLHVGSLIARKREQQWEVAKDVGRTKQYLLTYSMEQSPS
jgi:hypothetical protein